MWILYIERNKIRVRSGNILFDWRRDDIVSHYNVLAACLCPALVSGILGMRASHVPNLHCFLASFSKLRCSTSRLVLLPLADPV